MTTTAEVRPHRARYMGSVPAVPRFGFLAWGGPVAQVAMIRRELADEEHWVTGERFNWTLAVYSASVQGSWRIDITLYP